MFAARVFFQDFDNPADDWQTGPNRFIQPGGAAVAAQREVVATGNTKDAQMLRGNWARNFTDPITHLTTGDTPGARYTNVVIGTASRGIRDEIFLQHWVWFDPGVVAAPDNNIKFAWFNGGDSTTSDFDWFLNLDSGNFDTFRLMNNSNGNVGGANPPSAKFSSAPGASALIGAMSPADWFRGRWHLVQVHMKLNTANDRADGVFRFWLDGIKVLDVVNVDFRNDTADTFRQVLPLGMHGGPDAPPTSFGWQLDEVELWDGLPARPTVTSAEFLYETRPHRVRFSFDQNVEASLSVTDLVLEALGPGGSVTATAPTYDDVSNTATFALDPDILSDGNYRARLVATGVQNASNMSLSADFTLDFFVFAGDANRDRQVDFDDQAILAQNYNTTGKSFSQGNFDYDPAGNVDSNDQAILAQR